jgi:hypothetical protein
LAGTLNRLPLALLSGLRTMDDKQQQFLNDLDKRLWTAADKLRANLNPGDYMHVVLGLVFLKYVSDAFKERREELKKPPSSIRPTTTTSARTAPS